MRVRPKPGATYSGDYRNGFRNLAGSLEFEPATERPMCGWTPNSYYAVDIRPYKVGPWHRTILYVGYLNPNGTPGRRSCYLHPAYRLMVSDRPVALIRVVGRLELGQEPIGLMPVPKEEQHD